MSAWWLLALVIAVGLLLRSLGKRMAADRIGVFSEKRRGTSLIVSRGELVDGNRHLEVALALTDSVFIYENADLEGCLERSMIHEVEYEDELSTGQPVRGGKVLRLRCFSTTFEFVIPGGDARQWQAVLPPHRMVPKKSLAGAIVGPAAAAVPLRAWAGLR